MSRCDHCEGEIQTMYIKSERPYEGGLLVVTDVPAEVCGCEEGQQILLDDGAMIAGYAKHLASMKIVGKVEVSLKDLKGKFSIQDFVSRRVSPA
ncbi:hypothetical protein AB4Z50_14850 [Paenibacillus sp. 2TAB26]|uniref:YgiT-type zinc finger protein n=1 Tax=Paenibacillus sp. 2TAB26 TaxID=3233005 RepID=UPI003F98F9CC